MFIYIYMHICAYIYVYLYIYIYMFIYTYVYIFMYIYTFICISKYTYTYSCIYIHKNIYLCIHVHTNMRIYVSFHPPSLWFRIAFFGRILFLCSIEFCSADFSAFFRWNLNIARRAFLNGAFLRSNSFLF